MKRKLPILLERDLNKVRTERYTRAEAFTKGVREAASAEGLTITCSAGCSACCTHPVMIGLLEGILVYRWLTLHGMWTADLRARLTKHASETWALAHEVWWLSNIPCPLLVDDRCSVHEGRPFVCRATISTGDPTYCHPHRLGLETGIVPRAAVVDEFQRLEEQKLRANGLVALQLPISKALLVAEAILSGTLAIEAVAASLVKDFKAEA